MKLPLILFITMVYHCSVECFLIDNLITVPPDTFRNVSQLISSKGYPVEEYKVVTPDGYILALQNIPYGKTGSRSSGKPVVFLLHAFLYDSSQWVLNSEKNSLGFILADEGYDVWLGNVRGNTYTRQNARLSPNQVEFWDFSFDQFAKYDVPTSIDFILRKTGQKQLSYIGHSQGTTTAFALLSMSPEFNEKINFFIALAPVTYTTYLGGLLGLGIPFIFASQPFYKELGLVEFFPHTVLTELISVFICGTQLKFICSSVWFAIIGYDPPQLNYTRLPLYFNHVPAGVSTKECIHYSQMHYSGKFQMYDYFDRNNEVYGQPTPPLYDLSKITTPVATLSGLNDIIADPIDVARTQSQLNTLVESYVVPDVLFNHLDFTEAIDGYPLVYKKVLTLLRKYGSN